MRGFVLFLLGLLVGAAVFHLFYMAQKPVARCLWDHPLDRQAREACEAEASFNGYAKRARKELDDLIGDVSH